MKIIFIIGLGLLTIGCSRETDDPSVRAILMEQLKNTHTNKDWYVPINMAIEGLTADQSNWRDSSDNHSIGQLVSHLIFWNERVLIAFQGNTPPNFDGNNEVTFKELDGEEWNYAIKKLDSIQTTWEQMVEKASTPKLKEWSSSIANMCTHNAYHTGQIIYIRKRNGWWKQEKPKN